MKATMKPAFVLLVLLFAILFDFSSAWELAKPCPINHSFHCGLFEKYCDEKYGTWKCDFGLRHGCLHEKLPEKMICYCQHYDGVNICSYPPKPKAIIDDLKAIPERVSQVLPKAALHGTETLLGIPKTVSNFAESLLKGQGKATKNNSPVMNKEVLQDIPKALTDFAQSVFPSQQKEQDSKIHGHHPKKIDETGTEKGFLQIIPKTLANITDTLHNIPKALTNFTKTSHVTPTAPINFTESPILGKQGELQGHKTQQEAMKYNSEVMNKEVLQVIPKALTDFTTSMPSQKREEDIKIHSNTKKNDETVIKKDLLQVIPKTLTNLTKTTHVTPTAPINFTEPPIFKKQVEQQGHQVMNKEVLQVIPKALTDFTTSMPSQQRKQDLKIHWNTKKKDETVNEKDFLQIIPKTLANITDTLHDIPNAVANFPKSLGGISKGLMSFTDSLFGRR